MEKDPKDPLAQVNEIVAQSDEKIRRLQRAEERENFLQKIKFLENQVAENKAQLQELSETSKNLSEANHNLSQANTDIAQTNQNLAQANEKLAETNSKLAQELLHKKND